MSYLCMPLPDHPTTWIMGTKGPNKIVNREEADLVALAWRALYAEIIRARLDNEPLNFDRAIAQFITRTLNRVKAYGARWYTWYSRQRFHKNAKIIPPKHWKKKLITSAADGSYTINPTLRKSQ